MALSNGGQRAVSNMMRNARFGGVNRPIPPYQGGPVFPGGGGPQHGYQGLGGLMDILQGGVSQGQLDRMSQGYNTPGGVHGAFTGLSPQAMHFLATSGLLEKQAPAQQALTNPDGTPLTGDALFQAQFMNTLAGQQPSQYKLHSGVDQSFLEKALGMLPGGASAYGKGFDASGAVPPPVHGILAGGPGHGQVHPPGWTGMGANGFGQGLHGVNPGHMRNRGGRGPVRANPLGIKGWH